ncbi:RibD family protein [Flindersiella endophytica]
MPEPKPARPYVVLSAAMSIDGYLDDKSDQRLLLSNDEDFDRVDEVRSSVDAILVGAGTIRADDPRLLVRSPVRRASRVARGLAENPVKVALTARGELDSQSRFFTTGDGEKLVYVGESALEPARANLGGVATVVAAGDPLDLPAVLADLYARGVRRLMVEGGGRVHTEFLTAGLADELQLVVAPLFVGDPKAPRFVAAGRYPPGRLHLTESRRIGDCVLLSFQLS